MNTTTVQIHPATAGRLAEVQARVVTAAAGIGADPALLPLPDLVDLCACIALRHPAEAAALAAARGVRRR